MKLITISLCNQYDNAMFAFGDNQRNNCKKYFITETFQSNFIL